MLVKLNREEGKPPELERVNPASLHYEPGRRRVILFPGEGVSDQAGARLLIGSFKYIEQALTSARAQQAEPVDIFLYTYEIPYEDFGAQHAHYRMERQPQSHYGRLAAQFAVLPMLLGKGERLGDLTPEVLKQRFSSLTLFSHSYGSIAVQDTADVLVSELKRLGWQDAVIAETMKELVEISVAPIARGDFPAPNLTKFYFTGTNDMTAIHRIRSVNSKPETLLPILKASGYGTAASVIAAHADGVADRQLLAEIKEKVTQRRNPDRMPRPTIQRLPAGYVLSGLLPEDEIRWIEENSKGEQVNRHLHVSDYSQDSIVHDPRTFLHSDHKLGECLINVANNAVMREPGIGDAHQLLMTTELTRGQLHTRLENHKRVEPFISQRALAERKSHPMDSARGL